MFDALTDKLQGIFSGLRGRGKLTESDIDQAMRAIRLSLLEADVSLPVVKQLTSAIGARAKRAGRHRRKHHEPERGHTRTRTKPPSNHCPHPWSVTRSRGDNRTTTGVAAA